MTTTKLPTRRSRSHRHGTKRGVAVSVLATVVALALVGVTTLFGAEAAPTGQPSTHTSRSSEPRVGATHAEPEDVNGDETLAGWSDETVPTDPSASDEAVVDPESYSVGDPRALPMYEEFDEEAGLESGDAAAQTGAEEFPGLEGPPGPAGPPGPRGPAGEPTDPAVRHSSGAAKVASPRSAAPTATELLEAGTYQYWLSLDAQVTTSDALLTCASDLSGRDLVKRFSWRSGADPNSKTITGIVTQTKSEPRKLFECAITGTPGAAAGLTWEIVLQRVVIR